MKLALVPMGRVEDFVLRTVTEELTAYGDVDIRPSMPPPPGARDRHDGRYLANVCLDEVRRLEGERILGLTDVDLCTGTSDWVFGFAEVPGRAALVSVHRLRCNDRGLYLSRVLKETLHELGHTMGLDHCPRARCVMHFSKEVEDTDYKAKEFCSECVPKLRF